MLITSLHAVRGFVAPPERYPFAFDLAIAVFGCLHFLFALGMAYWTQFLPLHHHDISRSRDDRKKK